MNIENVRKAIAFFREMQKTEMMVDGSIHLRSYANPQGVRGIWNMNAWILTRNTESPFNRILDRCLSRHWENNIRDDVYKWIKEHSCGTMNCALGWIGISEVFPNLSITEGTYDDQKEEWLTSSEFNYTPTPPMEFADFPYLHRDPQYISRSLFGFTERQFNRLFGGSVTGTEWKTPADIADEMESMINHDQAETDRLAEELQTH